MDPPVESMSRTVARVVASRLREALSSDLRSAVERLAVAPPPGASVGDVVAGQGVEVVNQR